LIRKVLPSSEPKVTVTSVTKGTADEVLTNDSGNYTVSHLIPDTYNIRVEAQGFKAYEVKNVQVSADTSAKVDATMAVAPSRSRLKSPVKYHN